MTFPDDGEGNIQWIRRSRFAVAAINSPILKHKTTRFNTSDNTNSDCLLKELITGFGFMVDQHKYARASKRLWLHDPFPVDESETFREQCGRFQSAMEFENTRCDALQRLDVMFETLKCADTAEVASYRGDAEV